MNSMPATTASNYKMRRRLQVPAAILVAMLVTTPLVACSPTQVITHGAVITQDQIDLIPVGSSKDQVLLALGSPSTQGNFDAEAFYYISQKKKRQYAYSKGEIVDQRILAVYFDPEGYVAQVANYGIQDGRLFDFISRTTPTGGKDLTFLGQILAGPSKGGTSIPQVLPQSRTGL